MRRLALVALAAALLPAAAAAATPSPMHQVERAVLNPSQVGNGYLLLVRKDSTGTTTPTLNLCGLKGYPSEKLRMIRVQVDYGRRGSSLALSNEVVKYKPGGSKQALREVTQHARTCPKGLVNSGQPGVPKLRFRFTVLHDKKLLKDSIVLRIRAIGTVQGKHIDQTSYAVYQVYGDILSGVYSSGPNTKVQLAFVLHAAEQAAKNLTRGGKPSGPSA